MDNIVSLEHVGYDRLRALLRAHGVGDGWEFIAVRTPAVAHRPGVQAELRSPVLREFERRTTPAPSAVAGVPLKRLMAGR